MKYDAVIFDLDGVICFIVKHARQPERAVLDILQGMATGEKPERLC